MRVNKPHAPFKSRSNSFGLRHAARTFCASKSGNSVIEFALVSPLLFMLIAGILAYGLYLGTAHSVEQLAADSARASVAGLTNSERVQIAVRQVAEHGREYPLLDPRRIEVLAAPTPGDPDQFLVKVSYDAKALPIWMFDHLVPLPDKTIIRTASIKRGGY